MYTPGEVLPQGVDALRSKLSAGALWNDFERESALNSAVRNSTPPKIQQSHDAELADLRDECARLLIRAKNAEARVRELERQLRER